MAGEHGVDHNCVMGSVSLRLVVNAALGGGVKKEWRGAEDDDDAGGARAHFETVFLPAESAALANDDLGEALFVGLDAAMVTVLAAREGERVLRRGGGGAAAAADVQPAIAVAEPTPAAASAAMLSRQQSRFIASARVSSKKARVKQRKKLCARMQHALGYG